MIEIIIKNYLAEKLSMPVVLKSRQTRRKALYCSKNGQQP